MSALTFPEADKWIEINKSQIETLYNSSKGQTADIIYRGRKTSLGAAIVNMVDPKDLSVVIETLLVVISKDVISNDTNLVGQHHLDLVNSEKGTTPVSELILQIDNFSTIIDHTFKSIPETK